MFNAKLQSNLVHILKESGLSHCPQFYRDIRFTVAILAGIVILFLIHQWLPVFSSTPALHLKLLISVLIWQPLIEELLFRGIIQGQLSRQGWGQYALFNITTANVVTSVLFVALHMFNNSPVWSLTILIPSLVYGYFRDRFNSVYPSMLLHSSYNAMVVLGIYFMNEQ